MVNVFAVPVLLLIRVYEFIAVSAHSTSAFALLFVQALVIDMVTVAAVLFFLTLIFGALSLTVGERAAMRVHCALLSVYAILSLALSHYYSVSRIPLGSDLFGYSWEDIAHTISASGGISLSIPIGIAVITGVMFLLPRFVLRLPAPKQLTMAFYAFCTLSLPLMVFINPEPKDFASESDYQMVINKTAAFGSSSVRYFSQRVSGTEQYSALEYPFMKEARYDDMLGPFLSPNSTPPNIVIVIVEGLGSAFVEGGTYQGFTPFIDSLSQHGLTWKNFLSTSGRTFAVLPSLTASLPFGPQGFMELADAMPEHRSLFTLLKANGYRTSYYYGGAIGFDKQNVFLERQKIDAIVEKEDFPSSYALAAPNGEGFSWGYPDGDLFDYSLKVIGQPGRQPRLDVYMTISTHEPFIPPQAEYYRAAAERIISGPDVTGELRRQFVQNGDVFVSLLYLDSSLREFFAAYKQRSDYANTIFIITGDHRLIPVPMESKIDRYRVPFIIASPMIVRPKEFLSVSTHADVVPTLLGFLKHHYAMDLPAQDHWIGTPVDTAAEFRNLRSRAFMPYKGEISDFIHGTYFLSGDRLFSLNSRLYADEIRQDSIRDLLRFERDEFVRKCSYVIAENRLMPAERRSLAAVPEEKSDSLFPMIDSWQKNSDQLYAIARDTAFKKYYEQARHICRRLLALNPDYHDVRSLMASTYAWERRYEEARSEFREIVRRAPNYADAHFGLARVEFWNGNFDGALSAINRTIELMPQEQSAKILKAKILFTMKRDDEAMKEVTMVLQSKGSPATAEALELKEKYSGGKIR
jgi:tetratricopeptide (TPR) repeat protein